MGWTNSSLWHWIKKQLQPFWFHAGEKPWHCDCWERPQHCGHTNVFQQAGNWPVYPVSILCFHKKKPKHLVWLQILPSWWALSSPWWALSSLWWQNKTEKTLTQPEHHRNARASRIIFVPTPLESLSTGTLWSTPQHASKTHDQWVNQYRLNDQPDG